MVDPDELLADLDDQQRQAVTTDQAPLCVLAGAGSGKTRVLTRRIAWRCATGRADAHRVLALTFTRAAARELGARLRRLGLRDEVRAGTFHATAWAELRAWHAGAGSRPPTVLDRPGRLLAQVLDLDRGALAEVVTELGWARARLVDPDRYPEAARVADRPTSRPPEAIAADFRRYEAEKHRRGLVDFDDLLERFTALIADDPAVAAAQRWRHAHLFVDEFQDVNPLQLRLLEAWRGSSTDLCVVGDPNQAIYAWNGADPSAIERFADRHPGGGVVEVGTNYRSSPEIVALANALLDAGSLGGVRLRAVRPEGPPPVVLGFADADEEARAVARAVVDARTPGSPWSHQAVLVRTNAQVARHEAALRAVGVPVRRLGQASLLDDPAVREALRRLEDAPGFAAAVAELAATVEDGDRSPGDGRASTAQRLAELVELADEFARSDARPDGPTFRAWLRGVAAPGAGDGDGVDVGTFHGAKGLEWPVVHVAGVEDGLVPLSRARRPDARAEERRLLYVACTRATRSLRLTWAAARTIGASTAARRPSPFLVEVAPTLSALADGLAVAAPEPHLHDARRHLSPGAGTATSATAPVPAAGAVDHDLAATEAAIDAWRARRARQAGVAPSAVLADSVARAVARARPTDLDELRAVTGTGALVLGGLAEELLEVLAGAAGPAPG